MDSSSVIPWAFGTNFSVEWAPRCMSCFLPMRYLGFGWSGFGRGTPVVSYAPLPMLHTDVDFGESIILRDLLLNVRWELRGRSGWIYRLAKDRRKFDSQVPKQWFTTARNDWCQKLTNVLFDFSRSNSRLCVLVGLWRVLGMWAWESIRRFGIQLLSRIGIWPVEMTGPTGVLSVGKP